MLLDVLLLTLDNLQTLEECLQTLKNNTINPYRIFIWDNGSTDKRFIKYLDGLTASNINIFKSEENLGVGPGRRKLSDLSNADYMMFLDSDMMVTKRWDQQMIKLIDKFHAGAVAARFRKGVSDIVQANGGWCAVEKKRFLMVHHYAEGLALIDPIAMRVNECHWLPGGVMMITKEMNNKVKYLDYGYKIGFEDIDYSFRARKAKFSMYSCPDTDFFHHHLKKEPGYSAVRKNRVDLLLSIALFTEIWQLNPIKSWTVDRFLFKKKLTDAEIDKIIKFVVNHKDDREAIENKIRNARK